MSSEIPDMEFGEKSAKVRALGMTLEFAPVDFLGCIVSGYSDEELEKVITSIESNGDDVSVNYRNNISLIAEYRADKRVEDQINKFEGQVIDDNHPLFYKRYSVHRHDDGSMVAHGRRDLLEQKCILRSYGEGHWIMDNINTRISYILINGKIKKVIKESAMKTIKTEELKGSLEDRLTKFFAFNAKNVFAEVRNEIPKSVVKFQGTHTGTGSGEVCGGFEASASDLNSLIADIFFKEGIEFNARIQQQVTVTQGGLKARLITFPTYINQNFDFAMRLFPIQGKASNGIENSIKE